MLNTNHSNRFGTDTTTDEARERGRSLKDLVLDLLQAEFAGVLSHVRGERYGGR